MAGWALWTAATIGRLGGSVAVVARVGIDEPGPLGGFGSGSDSLPFTGMAVGPVAALGAGLTAAGATLRRFARRG